MSQIILGTVQFGLDYGISNSRGRITENEVFEILDYAKMKGINILDTANAYGSSEEVLGKYFASSKNKFNVISKLPKVNNVDEAYKKFNESLDKLHIERIYGYMFHDFSVFLEHKEILEFLQKIKYENNTEKIGFSLYFPTELEYLLENKIEFDILQIPYNIFDRRFEKYFEELKNKNVEIHVRSIFLQGLVFKNPDELGTHFDKIKLKLKKLREISSKENISISSLCLTFVDLNKSIDGIIVGVDSLNNFMEILDYKKSRIEMNKLLSEFEDFLEYDESIILPFNWR